MRAKVTNRSKLLRRRSRELCARANPINRIRRIK